MVRRLASRLAPPALLMCLVAVVSAPEPAAASSGPQGHTFVTMVSDPREYVGRGQDRLFYPGNGSVNVSGDASYVRVSVSGGNLGDYYTLSFAAPPGDRLEPGAYERAQRASSRQSGRPGIDIFGSGRGCNTVSGRFDVKEIDVAADGSVRSLRLLYEHHCEGGLEALFGEVRYNIGTGTDLFVAPSAVRWPDAEIGQPMTVVPINVINSGTVEQSVTESSITGEAANEYSIRADECTGIALAPGQGCSLWVRFTPSATGTRSARLTLVDSTGAKSIVLLHGFVVDGYTRLAMRSDSGDWIGQGHSYDYSMSNATLEVTGSRHGVHMSVRGADGSWWYGDFRPPSGDIFASGSTYSGALRYPFNESAPGLSVHGNGHGCNKLEGTFTITTISVDDDGSLRSVGITFEQHCESERPALRGSLGYRTSLVPLPPASNPPVGPPAPEVDDGPRADSPRHARTVALKMGLGWGAGRLTVPNGPARCARGMNVAIQRLQSGVWRTVGRDVTGFRGRYELHRKFRPGRYRSFTPRAVLSSTSVCGRAVSTSVRKS